MKIFLIGYMGSGKTTLGRLMASRLNYPFVDLDTLIEESEDTTIPALFASPGGEARFRELERYYLEKCMAYEDVLVSTGGGTPCFGDNMERMNDQGLTIYLRFSPRTLAERLTKARTRRPLIDGKSPDELLAYIEETLPARETYYNKANVIIDTPPRDVNRILDIIGPYFATTNQPNP